MRIADIKENDIVDGEGVCVSVWFQRMPTPLSADATTQKHGILMGGRAIGEQELFHKVLELINKNDIQRNLSLLGGEPMCDANINISLRLLAIAKRYFPNIKTFVWTGYTKEELLENYGTENILTNIDVLIDGRFILEQRDIRLYLRGSKNQRVLKKGIDFLKKI